MFERIVKNKNLKYNIMFIGNQLGIISDKQWSRYCDSVLEQLMSDHKEVFERMKFK